MLDQIKRLVLSLTRSQQISIVLAALAVAGGLSWIFHRQQEKDFKPLYTSLGAEDAGQVVAKLKESNAEYRLADGGGTVLVRAANVAEMRLRMASSGLPKTGRIGFELFDKTNFGATDFAEQVNFRRALEGELERSVMSISEVELARVHLTFSKDSVFSDLRQPAKASVLLKLKKDARLSAKNVVAVGHLVANAVEGLNPEGVSIVDMQGNLLSKEKKQNGQETGDVTIESPIEYRQRIERDLLAKVVSTLEPVMGPEHFRAGVSVEVDFSSGEQSEESYDPNRSVITNQQRSEEMSAPKETAGIPGTPTNLPKPTTRPGSAGGNNGIVRRTENTQYQSSRTVRRTRLPQGSVRRISASVVLDQQVQWEGVGSKARRTLVPPPEETLKKVRDMIAGAVGFQQERGDQIFVQSLPFETTLRMAPPADPAVRNPATPGSPTPNTKDNSMLLIGIGTGVLMFIAGAALLLLMRRKKKAARKVEVNAAIEGATGAPAVEGAGPKAQVEGGAAAAAAAVAANEAEMEEAEQRKVLDDANSRKEAQAMLNAMRLPTTKTKKADVLAKHISEEAKRDPAMVAGLIRSWINEKERE